LGVSPLTLPSLICGERVPEKKNIYMELRDGQGEGMRE